MSHYNTRDFQTGKRFRDDSFENAYIHHRQTQNYGLRHDMINQHPQPGSVYPDYDRMNIYSTIKDIEEKHFSEVKKLKKDICDIDDIIYSLKNDREKDRKYIVELEQNLTKERILKEKYKNSEKNLIEKIAWLESSNNDMKMLLDKFSQQIPYSIQISPTNKDKSEQEQQSEQDNSSDSDKEKETSE